MPGRAGARRSGPRRCGGGASAVVARARRGRGGRRACRVAVVVAAAVARPAPRLRGIVGAMLSPLSLRLDPPRVRAGWLRMMLRVFRRHDRNGLYREMIALTERLIADATREDAANGHENGKAP